MSPQSTFDLNPQINIEHHLHLVALEDAGWVGRGSSGNAARHTVTQRPWT